MNYAQDFHRNACPIFLLSCNGNFNVGVSVNKIKFSSIRFYENLFTSSLVVLSNQMGTWSKFNGQG
jgi:hypothetical protein